MVPIYRHNKRCQMEKCSLVTLKFLLQAVNNISWKKQIIPTALL